ncbi:Mitochondrial import inner membrane translocase subunit Tim17-A [Pleosporales sp. CAS-2024a]
MHPTEFNSTSPWLHDPSATSMDPSTLTDYLNLPQLGHCALPFTWDACGIDYSSFAYRPNKHVNMAFAILFALSTLLFLAQGIVMKKNCLGFTIAMLTGCAIEVAGYVARVLAYDDMYSDGPFLSQIVCLTIAPAFLAAGIYLCLSKIVSIFGQDNSRISARAYPRIFIACDVISLVLQATGGGIASVKAQDREDPKLGNNIMIAGLAFQVFSLLIFMLLAVDFALRTIGRIRQLGTQDALDPRFAALRGSWIFKGFLVALTISTLCIFTRCVYRVAELSEGWEGHLMKVQRYFIGLEGAVVVAAVFLLNMFHPGYCFCESNGSSSEPKSKRGRNWRGRSVKSASDEGSTVELKAYGGGADGGIHGGHLDERI